MGKKSLSEKVFKSEKKFKQTFRKFKALKMMTLKMQTVSIRSEKKCFFIFQQP